MIDAKPTKARVLDQRGQLVDKPLFSRGEVADDPGEGGMMFGQTQQPGVVVVPGAGFDHDRRGDAHGLRQSDKLGRQDRTIQNRVALARPGHAFRTSRVIKMGVGIDDGAARMRGMLGIRENVPLGNRESQSRRNAPLKQPAPGKQPPLRRRRAQREINRRLGGRRHAKHSAIGARSRSMRPPTREEWPVLYSVAGSAPSDSHSTTVVAEAVRLPPTRPRIPSPKPTPKTPGKTQHA